MLCSRLSTQPLVTPRLCLGDTLRDYTLGDTLIPFHPYFAYESAREQYTPSRVKAGEIAQIDFVVHYSILVEHYWYFCLSQQEIDP